uniref:Uncharacterized protein n=1 Tax=Oryza sativa subsp. japonica TaxID=39947 RepID=Q339B0_ORYSJ|nr:hypothetical protein LOC_Os10g22900 [Oryza sativa Japonica Group]
MVERQQQLLMGRIHYSERAGTGTPATASYSAATDQVGSFFSDEIAKVAIYFLRFTIKIEFMPAMKNGLRK